MPPIMKSPYAPIATESLPRSAGLESVPLKPGTQHPGPQWRHPTWVRQRSVALAVLGVALAAVVALLGVALGVALAAVVVVLGVALGGALAEETTAHKRRRRRT